MTEDPNSPTPALKVDEKRETCPKPSHLRRAYRASVCLSGARACSISQGQSAEITYLIWHKMRSRHGLCNIHRNRTWSMMSLAYGRCQIIQGRSMRYAVCSGYVRLSSVVCCRARCWNCNVGACWPCREDAFTSKPSCSGCMARSRRWRILERCRSNAF